MATIPLTNGGVTLIDDADLPLVAGLRFCRHSRGYAQTTRHPQSLLHRLLMNPPLGMVVDHIDHDRLNNQRSNLRIVSHSVNHFNPSRLNSNNSSGYRGVFLDHGRWSAAIKINGVRIYAGMHDTPESAAVARRTAELAHADEIGLLVKA